MDAKTDTPPPSTEQQLDALFKDINRTDTPGCVVGVRRGGASVYRRAFGMASLELGVANTPLTRMRIGSTSKHFTSVAVLLLAEEGKLNIDAPVRRYVPELPAPQADGAAPTLRQLMSHTGGLRDYLDVVFLADGLVIQPVGTALATQARQTEANFAPGDKMVYCNGGYHLLSICIARASGMPFEQFVKTRIFEPMDMRDTDSVPSDFELVRGHATLHATKADGGWRRGVFPSEEVRGEGAMISTTDDMLQWLAHLRAPNRLLQPASWRQLIEPGRLSDGSATTYALGLMLHRYRGVDVMHHGGGVIGGACQMLTVPAHALDIVIITNGAALDPHKTANRIVDIVLGDDVLAAPDPVAMAADHAALAGTTYWSRASGLVVGFGEAADDDQKKGHLGLSVLGNPPLALVQRDGVLELPLEHIAIGPWTLPLPQSENGQAPASITAREGAITERYEKLGAAPTVADVSAALVGRYRSHDAAADATVSVSDAGELEIKVDGRMATIVYHAEPLATELLRCKPRELALPLVSMVSIERGGDGSVTGLRFSSGRTRRLLFARCG